ncbi:MAG: hypothetical protein FJX47_04935 [Alphaproteobacteria bacterium]|nr:hypothetical protein [Alphaproteobacteria bacterium]
MPTKPLRTQRQHRRALAEIERLMGARKGTREGERLDALVTSVEAFEAEHCPLPRRFGAGRTRSAVS